MAKYNPANNYEVIEGNQSLFRQDKLIKTVEIKASRFSFDQRMFTICTKLESVTFSNDVLTHFETFNRSFAGCNNLKNIYGLNISLSNINDHVNIFGNSFQACLKINFHYTVQSGDDFTQVLHAYHSKFDHTGADKYTFIETGDSFYDVIEDGIISPKANATFPSNLVIPKTIINKNGVVIKVKGVADNAFKDNNQIQSISFPTFDDDQQFSIGNNAFANCPNLSKITFTNSKYDIFTVDNNAFVNCQNLNTVEIHQDLDHADQTSIDAIKKGYKAKLAPAGVSTNATYSTWYDSNTNSPTEQYNVYNFSANSNTTINNGFKIWKDAANNRSVKLKYRTSNNITATGTIDDSLSTINTTIVGNQPNIEEKEVTFTPILELSDGASNSIQDIELSSGAIRLNANDQVSTTDIKFNLDYRVTVERNGLWAGNDSLSFTVIADRAYFNDDWNNQDAVIQKFNQYFYFMNNCSDRFDLTQNADGWFNDQVGTVVPTIKKVNNTFEIGLTIYKTYKGLTAHYKSQILMLYLTNGQAGIIKNFFTYAPDYFKPNTTFTGNGDNVNLNFNESQIQDQTRWNLDQQNFDIDVAKNDFDWYANKGYSFRLDKSSFSSEYFQLGDEITLNDEHTQFSLNVKLIKPNIDPIDLEVNNLKVVAHKDGESDVEINLPPFLIHSWSNNTFVPNKPEFTKSSFIPATRTDDGLWALSDSYLVTAQINKAYFNNDWNNQQNILNNLNKYFKFINGAGDELTLNSLGNNEWFNSELGTVIFNISSATETTYNFLFKIFKNGGNNEPNYQDQTINCFLRTKTDNNQVFVVQTFNKYKFKPEFYFNEQTPEPVQLSLDNLTQNVIFKLGFQNSDPNLVKNAFEWYLKNGYSLSVDTSSFSDDNISVGKTISINDDFTRLSFPINLTTPNINEKTLNINNLSVLAHKEGMPDTTITLPQFSVSLSTNNNFNETHQLNKNTVINNNRDGLWIPGDIFQTNLTINKAYFGSHYNDKDYIKTHFDEFINVEGKSTYTFNHNEGTNIYTHPQIGQLEIANIEENNHNWQITLKFSLPELDQYKLLTQTINFIPKLDPTKRAIFSLLTKSIDEYDPNWNGLEANNLTLPFNEQNGTVIWNDTDQNKVKTLGNTNTCKWAISKGYSLEISDFTNEFISIDQQATFDVKANQLKVNFKKLKQIVENQNINLSGLKLLIKDGNNVIKEITLPDLVVTLSVQHFNWVPLLTSIFSTILVVGLTATFGVYLKEKRTKETK